MIGPVEIVQEVSYWAGPPYSLSLSLAANY